MTLMMMLHITTKLACDEYILYFDCSNELNMLSTLAYSICVKIY